MDKVIAKRAAIISGIIAIILLLSYACSVVVGREDGPTLSNPNGVFLTFGDLEITNQMWYDRAKQNDGLNLVLSAVDAILLEDYIAAVTADEIAEVRELLRFGTNDPVEISRLSERDLLRLQQAFEDLIIVSGFDPSDQQSVDRFLSLTIAKEAYAADYILNLEAGRALHISEERLAQYYNDTVKGSLQAVVLRFKSAAEADSVFAHFNLVRDFEDGLGLYEGDVPIENVTAGGFNLTNTRVLSETEVFETYVMLYNYLHPYVTTIDDSLTPAQLTAASIQALQYDFTEMINEDIQNPTLEALAVYLFNRRTTEAPYSTRLHTVGTQRVMAYVLDRTPAPAFDTLGEGARLSLAREMAGILASDEVIQDAMVQLYRDAEMVLYDRSLAIQFQESFNVNLYEEPSDRETVIRFNDQTLTADEVLALMAERVGALYSVDIATELYLLNSDFYTDVFSNNRNVWSNNSEDMQALRQQIRQDKLQFNNGAYAQFGFSPQFMTWDDFLLFAYGIVDETAYLNALVTTRLRPLWLHEAVDFERGLDYVNEQVDNYFSLNVQQILISVDRDQDFRPDNFEVYLDSLSPSEADTLLALVEALYVQVSLAHDEGEGLAFSDIVAEYQKALRGENPNDDDFSLWARFKNAGLELRFENLSAQQSLNYNNTRGFVAPFVAGVKAFYDQMVALDDEDLTSSVFDEVIQTNFGAHILFATPGAGFNRPPVVPTQANLVAFHEAMKTFALVVDSQEALDNLVREELGAALYTAIQTFYGPHYQRLESAAFANYTMLGILNEDATFTIDATNQAQLLTRLTTLFERRVFPPLD